MGLGGVEALGEEAGGGHLSNPSVLVISLNLSKRAGMIEVHSIPTPEVFL